MQDICPDLLDECRELVQLCRTLPPEQWLKRSEFCGWTPWDEIAHLCYFDEAGLQSASDPDRFAQDAVDLTSRIARGDEISAVARERYDALLGPALLAHWQVINERLINVLAELDPKDRLPWYGPPMGARSFATARLMEVWAHGQDVWDVVGRRRPATSRLKHIAHLGVGTFKWTFINRKLEAPQVLPYIELTAPDEGVWTWNEPSMDNFVCGSAEDFCLLVTQRRHMNDTDLRYSGAAVKQWLSMAQCFAGPPADGPPEGVRRIVY